MPRAKGSAGNPRARRDAAGAPRARGRTASEPQRELRARGQRTRRQLLDAGAQVFAGKGYFAA
ncbi:MAG TPA: hypothetical protein VL916_05990, partial [Ilumatobacteraceae bacterium]|nr:hypothetical protein [Ilumatobacteraceae bacterium]